MIKIAVRTYGRSSAIVKKTIGSLLAQTDLDLSRQLVLAVTADEYPLYAAALRDIPHLDMIKVPKGGCNATNGLIDYFPDGEQVVFMDDDIAKIQCYTDIMNADSRFDVDNLGQIFSYGFKCFDVKPFGINFTPNLMFKQGRPFAEFKMRGIGGAWWGAYNDKSLLKIKQSHEDDNIRTARVIKKYGGVGSINWLTAVTVIGTNPGGMQSSGDRGINNRSDETKTACESALQIPEVREFYQENPVFIQSMDFWTLRLKNIRDLRKTHPMNRETKWSTYLQDGPDLAPNLEDFF